MILMKATHPQLKKRLTNNGYRTTVVRKLILSLLLLLPLMLLLPVAPLLARVVQLRIMTGDSLRSGSDEDMVVLFAMLLVNRLLHVAGV